MSQTLRSTVICVIDYVTFKIIIFKGKLNVKAADVHLIGHSLGAHIAGYAGEKIAKLGRITGVICQHLIFSLTLFRKQNIKTHCE